MADEQNNEQEGKGGSPLLRTLITVGIVVGLSALLAWALYFFVLRGMLGAPEQEDPGEPVDVIPAGATPIELESMQAAVLTEDPEASVPILLYQVVLFCSSPEAAEFISSRKEWFTTMVAELHRNRTLTEVNDRYTQDAILKQITQRANELLRRFEAMEDYRVLEVKYKQFSPIVP